MESSKLPDQSGSIPDAGLLTVGSLFSGIGGFELGFEATGRFKTLWQVECDKYASKILEKHWPDVQRHDDVCTWPNETTQPVDVIIGGFPCQDISYAGKGAGLDGQRSGLFYELMRIVRVVGPKYVVLENVAALFTRGMDQVLGTLASHGYDAEWEVVSAQSVGAPHRRDRVFIIGWHADREHDEAVKKVSGRAFADTSGSGATLRDANGNGKPTCSVDAKAPELQGDVAHSIGSGTGDQNGTACRQEREPSDAFKSATLRQGNWQALPEGTDASGADCSTLADSDSQRGRSRDAERQDAKDARQSSRRAEHWGWHSESAVGRVANGVPKRMDRLRCLGNAIVPQVAQVVAERLLQIHDARASDVSDS